MPTSKKTNSQKQAPLKGGAQSFLDLLKKSPSSTARYTIHHGQRGGGASMPPPYSAAAIVPSSHSGPITEATLLNIEPAVSAIADPFAIYPAPIAPLRPSFQLGGAQLPPAHKKPVPKKKKAPAKKKP